MSNQTKKEEELTLLTEFLRFCSNPFAKILKRCQNISKPNQERPDIVLADEDTVYGIECIHVPLCKEGEGDADIVQKNRERRAVNKYHVDLDKGINKLEGHEEDAKSDLETIFNKKFEAYSNFNYDEYIRNCRELLGNHNTVKYRDNVMSWFPEKDCKICLLLDIAYPREIRGFDYYRSISSTKENSIRKDYPFTWDFLRELKSVQEVYRFMLVWHTERKFIPNETRCYVLNPDKEWKEQVPKIWGKFDFPDRYKHAKRLKIHIIEDKSREH